MPQLQRRTTLLLALFIAIGQVAGAFGFFWYFGRAIEFSSSTATHTFTPDVVSANWSSAWGEVYLCSVLAAILLAVFGTKGTKLWCSLFLVVLLPLVPWIRLVLATQ
jgi:hypothetical protein